MYKKFQIPNKVMKEIYTDYFFALVSKEIDFSIDGTEYTQMQEEIAIEGKIDKLIEILQKYLSDLSNRDFIKFDEKYTLLDEIKSMEKLDKFTVVVVNDEELISKNY